LRLDTNRLVELADGCVEVLPTPKTSHQKVVQFLSNLLLAYVSGRNLGIVLFAPLRVRLRTGKFCEPDIVFLLAEHAEPAREDYWEGADLVMEVVSPDDPDRDWVTKRADYAEARIPEYWIIDPRTERITIFKLQGNAYAVHGEYGAEQVAQSAVLAGFTAPVTAVFAAAKKRVEGP
jgi:Uma2 family endonuclease